MKKEYTKLVVEKYDEQMQPTGETEEHIFISLLPDDGMLIMDTRTGIKGTRVDLGTDDGETYYIEVEADASEVDYQEALAEMGVELNEEGNEA